MSKPNLRAFQQWKLKKENNNCSKKHNWGQHKLKNKRDLMEIENQLAIKIIQLIQVLNHKGVQANRRSLNL